MTLKEINGEAHGMNGKHIGLFRSCHATLCCVTQGKSPTLTEPSIVWIEIYLIGFGRP